MKYTYYDKMFDENASNTHTFISDQPETFTNLMKCSVCGLEGWIKKENHNNVIKSCYPKRKCIKNG